MFDVEKYQLQAKFLYANDSWGRLDNETGIWDGVRGMVWALFLYMYFVTNLKLQNISIYFFFDSLFIDGDSG